MLTPTALLARLDRRLPLLTGGSRDLPARQQTLRGTIAWSYDLLTPAEQWLFRQASVFADGCTAEDAALWVIAYQEAMPKAEAPDQERPAPDAVLTSLVEKSLVRQERREDQLRFTMLETIRELALEQLRANGEEEAARQRHLDHILVLARAAEPHLNGPDQNAWLDRLGRERENIRAAERWATERGDVEASLSLAASLSRFWRTRSSASEARERLDRVLRLAAIAPPIPTTVRALLTTGDMARILGEYAMSQALFEQGLVIARHLEDPVTIATALGELSRLAGFRGEYDEATRMGEEGLAILEGLSDPSSLAEALRELGMVNYLAGDVQRARALQERSLAVAREHGDQRTISNALFSLGLTYHVSGEIALAKRFYEESLVVNRAQQHRTSEGATLNNLGHVAMLEGDLATARTILHDSLVASREGGDRRRIAFTLSAVAGLMVMEGEPELGLWVDAAALEALDVMKATLAQTMRTLYNSHIAPGEAAIGPEATAAARARGRETSLERALQAALTWLATPSQQWLTSFDLEPAAGLRPEASAR
jgi:tetratricopeptide (TPR) repeat protein